LFRLNSVKIFGLSKNCRLTLKKDFDDIFNNGGKIISNGLVIRYRLNSHVEEQRMSIIVSRKLGNAVKRNRIKRLLKEVFRLNKNKLKKGTDIIFIPTINLKMENYKQAEEKVLKAYKKAEILDETKTEKK